MRETDWVNFCTYSQGSHPSLRYKLNPRYQRDHHKGMQLSLFTNIVEFMGAIGISDGSSVNVRAVQA